MSTSTARRKGRSPRGFPGGSTGGLWRSSRRRRHGPSSTTSRCLAWRRVGRLTLTLMPKECENRTDGGAGHMRFVTHWAHNYMWKSIRGNATSMLITKLSIWVNPACSYKRGKIMQKAHYLWGTSGVCLGTLIVLNLYE